MGLAESTVPDAFSKVDSGGFKFVIVESPPMNG
jgi:hypothetical protein